MAKHLCVNRNFSEVVQRKSSTIFFSNIRLLIMKDKLRSFNALTLSHSFHVDISSEIKSKQKTTNFSDIDGRRTNLLMF